MMKLNAEVLKLIIWGADVQSSAAIEGKLGNIHQQCSGEQTVRWNIATMLLALLRCPRKRLLMLSR